MKIWASFKIFPLLDSKENFTMRPEERSCSLEIGKLRAIDSLGPSQILGAMSN